MTVLLRQDEAKEFMDSVTDATTEQLLMRAWVVVLRRFMEQRDLPVSDFDHRFFVEVCYELFSDHDDLRKILAGEDLRMWTKEDLEAERQKQARRRSSSSEAEAVSEGGRESTLYTSKPWWRLFSR